jgi:dTDP-glucose 4,6-dehydratase
VTTDCSSNYRPWQFPVNQIPVVILKAEAGKPISLFGDGQNLSN